ncbi:Shugoshin [Cercospora beticola]|uniref:Shugoshin n=1 Tax=Cercospora beticola TaxID=122368 RepID=A0A2G5HP26_CERBT|nr:Shugoshin [Cercospora beticola]PIA93952.1 Shugoshin [Cercospora beticola]
MARLNEPPIAPAPTTATSLVAGVGAAGAESVEVLKRRFIRQNRELAKNNSTQSLRIRSLELEVSKLLSDNLDLREQVLSLQNELYDARMQASSAAARRVKQDLKAKLAELSGLVDGIDEGGDAVEERDMPEKARILSPSRQQYRERQPLAELMQDTQMPTITENKMFPRRTLEELEIREIRLSGGSTASGSPDLGPPPVAHFDDLPKLSQEDPVEPEDSSNQVEELLPSINLETRRKRKDPSQPRESRRSSILAHSPDKTDDAPTTILKTGAKRKLSDRDNDKPIKPPAQGDFTFSRKPSATQPAPEETEIPTVAIKPPVEYIERPSSPTKPGRRVLGDKSTNMSPVKTTRRATEPVQEDLRKPVDSKPTIERERAPSRSSRRLSSMSAIPVPAPHDDDAPAIAEIAPSRPSSTEVIPETPANFDVFSPATSQPSEKNGGRDTPPPADLSSISNTTEGSQRPSRRARSAVNYAEPSLVAKMRRPDKKMADAISGLQDPRRVMSTSTTTKRTGSGVVKIKEEAADDSSWGGLPHTSSLSRESMGSPLRHLTTDDRPHISPRPSPRASPARSSAGLLGDIGESIDVIPRSPRSSTADSISTLLANSRKRREALDKRISPPPDQVDAATKRLEELDLYDFKESSSPASVDDSSSTSGKVGGRVIAAHRRHSSVPKATPPATVTAAAAKSASASANAGTTATTTVGHGSRMASRRRSMMV